MSTSESVGFNQGDEEIYFRVCKFLQSRHFPAFRHLGVTVEQGIVTLTGRVCSFYEKQVAITSCQRVAGVKSLIDCIVVSDSKENDSFSTAQHVPVLNE